MRYRDGAQVAINNRFIPFRDDYVYLDVDVNGLRDIRCYVRSINQRNVTSDRWTVLHPYFCRLWNGVEFELDDL